MADRAGPGWVAWAGAGVLLVSTAVLSFSTLAELAARGGYGDWRRWLWPLTVDAAALVAVRFWLARGLPASARRFGLILALAMIGLSVVGNALEHWLAGGGVLPAVLGSVPPLVLAAVGLLIDLAVRRPPVATGVDTPAGASPPAPAAGGLVTSADEVRQPVALADSEAGTPGPGERPGRITLLRQGQAPAPAAGAKRPPGGTTTSASASLDAALLARARQVIAETEAGGRRIGRGALAERLEISPHQARLVLEHYKTNRASPPAAGDPDAGDTSQEAASA